MHQLKKMWLLSDTNLLRLTVKQKVRYDQLKFMSQQLQVQSVMDSKGRSIKTNKKNEDFEHFYRKQKICEEAEFPHFLESCRQGLPSVFRVLSHKPEAKLILSKLKNDQGAFKNTGIKQVDWYPDKTVFRFDKTRWDLKDVKEAHKLIEIWRLNGSIYRQEQVSMVPVACLDIQPGHAVLDMCSSPGSKTGQVLEAMHAGAAGEIPSGFVIANEVDISRCCNLTGNMNLLNSPVLAVTNYKGQCFPDLKDVNGNELLYDRIVCDVPCSGDGTIRKNPDIWNKWSPVRGNHRFFLQLNIARRGVELLKEGGLMAYSSCSINQIENECVMAALLKEFDGDLELVDMSGKFPGLRFEPGLTTWSVFGAEMTEFQSYDQVPENLKSQVYPQLFPDEKQNRDLRLERCMRFLPHYNDDGGFFVAILRKRKHRGGRKFKRGSQQPRGPTQADPKGLVKRVTDINISMEDNPELDLFKEAMGLSLDNRNVVSFSEHKSGGDHLFYVNDALRDVVVKNAETLQVCKLGAAFARRSNLKMSKEKYRLKSSAHWLINSPSLISQDKVVQISLANLRKLMAVRRLDLADMEPETRVGVQTRGHGHLIFHNADTGLRLPAFSSGKAILLLETKDATARTLCGLL